MRLFYAAVGVAVAVLAALWTPIPPNAAAGAGSVVKVVTGTGHGSGVHIGNGLVLTAAHVIKGETNVRYHLDDGSEGAMSILWRGETADIALVRMDGWSGVDAANLVCRTPTPGEALILRGNPILLENITTWGRVAGEVTQVGPWAAVVPVDGALAGGMSGGGAFDLDGNLVGLNVGMVVQPMGLGASAVGIALILPGEALCDMLERH